MRVSVINDRQCKEHAQQRSNALRHIKLKLGVVTFAATAMAVTTFALPAFATGTSGCGGDAGNLWPEGCVTVNGSGLDVSTITSDVSNEGNVTFDNVHYTISGPSISTYTTPSFNLSPGDTYYGATQYIDKDVTAGDYCQKVYEGSTQEGPSYCIDVHS
jgi:hypothetical protein